MQQVKDGESEAEMEGRRVGQSREGKRQKRGDHRQGKGIEGGSGGGIKGPSRPSPASGRG